MDDSETIGVPVRLPAGRMINCWELTRVTAKAVLPSLREAVGIDCIKKKVQLLEGTENSFSYKLDDEDREHLQQMLPDLPPLRGAVSSAQAKMFMNAYANHKNRKPWEPVLITEDDVTYNAWEIQKKQALHQAELQQRIDSREFVAVDSEHRRVKHTGYDSYISRANAIKFLAEHAFYAVPGKAKLSNQPEPEPAPKQLSASKDDSEKISDANPVPPNEEPKSELVNSGAPVKKRPQPRKNWSNGQKRDLYDIWEKAGGGGKGKGRNGVAAVLEVYPLMDRRWINQIVNDVRKELPSRPASPFDLAAALRPKRSRKS